MAALCLGWGWLVSAAVRAEVPPALLPGLGLAAMIVGGQALTIADATTSLAMPVAAAGGIAGLGLGVIRRRGRPPAWAVAAAVAVLCVYAAPIVFSGDATFAGFIKLDDDASWMAFTDQLMADGRDLGGLAPSSYEATLAINLGEGYPGGIFVPLGVATSLLGEDVAWLVQPYMAFAAALLALALWELAGGLVKGGGGRALVAAIAAQPALLFGYYLWGGIKEVAAVALLATAAALAPGAIEAGRSIARVLPLAVVCAGALGVLSLGGAIWLAPVLVVAAVFAWNALGPRATLARAAVLTGVTALLSVPLLWAGGLVPPTSLPLTDSAAIGNLAGALDPAQLAGIWPSGDFRFANVEPLVTGLLVAVAVASATAGVVIAWRRRLWAPVSFVLGALATVTVIALVGSPWVEGKAFATASVVIPFAALAGAGAVWGAGLRSLAVALGGLVAAGVLWSNALAYRDAALAPRERLAELEEVAPQIEGEGPTLMTEYNPYGVRHFLRDAAPEGVSELRRRKIPRLDGDPVPKGQWADTDELSLDDLLVYRTLVLRRSPAHSRPPSAYRLAWSGAYYEVWQREPGLAPDEPGRLGLGSALDPTGVPRCGEVRELADAGRPLIAAARPAPVVLSLAGSGYPEGWERAGSPGSPVPEGAGSLAVEADVPRDGAYEVWLRGSVKPEARVAVDGSEVGEVANELNHQGQYVRFGSLELDQGSHTVELALDGSDLHPGSGGARQPIGPITLSAAEASDTKLHSVPADQAERLCGRRWDWIEVQGE